MGSIDHTWVVWGAGFLGPHKCTTRRATVRAQMVLYLVRTCRTFSAVTETMGRRGAQSEGNGIIFTFMTLIVFLLSGCSPASFEVTRIVGSTQSGAYFTYLIERLQTTIQAQACQCGDANIRPIERDIHALAVVATQVY